MLLRGYVHAKPIINVASRPASHLTYSGRLFAGPILRSRYFQTSSAARDDKAAFDVAGAKPGGAVQIATQAPPPAVQPVLASAAPPTPPPGGLPPPPKRPGRFRRWWHRTKQVVGYGSLGLFASMGYYVYNANHPPEQLPFDPSKKTVVILGSGWAATSLLDGLDTTDYNVVVISPFNYFLFTPLLASCAVGTLNGRSIVQSTRLITRYKKREVMVVDASATKVDVANKTVTFEDSSDIHGNLGTVQMPFDKLVYAVGSENNTFGIKGVKENALFLKELSDAEAIRKRIMECIERASLPGQDEAEIDRLLHFLIVGGGPTGVEASGEIIDFVKDDLKTWYPAVSHRVRITLVEALPHLLPSFSKSLVEYTEGVFKANEIEVLTRHMVQEADEKSVTIKDPNGNLITRKVGALIWAGGNAARPLTRDMQSQLADVQKDRRGLLVDDKLRLRGAEEYVYVLGDAAITGCPPTAQVANQQGKYLAKVLMNEAKVEALEAQLSDARKVLPGKNEEVVRLERKLERTQASIKPFHYTNRGAMAYIGQEKAVLDLPFGHGQISTGGMLSSLAWSSAYWSLLFGIRSRCQVALDWMHVRVFGRSIECTL